MPVRTFNRKKQPQLDELQIRLQEAEDTLNAIRNGSIDALVVRTPRGEQLFTLKGADQTYRALVEAMTEGAVTLKKNIVSYCNHQFARMLRMPLEKVIGASILDFIPSASFAPMLRRLQESGASRVTLQTDLRTEGGLDVPVLISASRFSSEGSAAVCLVVTDISTQKAAEEALRVSEERFQIVARMTNDAIWDWSITTGRVWRSKSLAALFRFPAREIGNSVEWWQEHIHPADRKRVVDAIKAAVKSEDGFYSAVYQFRRGDDTYAHVSDRASVLRDAERKPVRMIGSMTDITEQREAEISRQQLSRSILNAQEQERHRVARDLHDSVNQLLSAAKFRLGNVAAKGRHHGDKDLDQAHQLIQNAINEVRVISRNLRPSELDDLGLIAALRSLTHDFKKRTGISTRFKGEMNVCPSPVPQEVELTLYRVAQEALNNVEKHSSASRADVQLLCTANHVTLTVRDNGKGFASRTAVGNQGGWGLQNMAERASLLGGSFIVNSATKKGTTVKMHFTLTPHAADPRTTP